ncbi:hypothetical protein LWC35_00920 [Pseudonocardia kujensis]|uniref:hypothetical protein n=1 Tax=Pseudonocardia kujensis TaxID=1128675 RepID=UPI001E428FC5|nr:hypothetical protein [Pseudonocardia kujensis]MCE0761484.1 hypothetical protein [Pseudonocardia kujensis]
MGLFDKLKERLAPSGTARQAGYARGGYAPRGGSGFGGPTSGGRAQDPDEAAVERYRYMLRTAPPETVEQAHAEAFAKLTPEQRQRVLADLGNEVPPAERATSSDPQALARMATRAEMRNPGTLERSFGSRGPGMGGMIAGTLLASVAGAFIGTAIADALFDDPGADGDLAAGAEEPVDEGGFDEGGFEGGDLGEF